MQIIADKAWPWGARARFGVALLVSVAALAGCRELRRADGTIDSEPDAETDDAVGSGGVAPDGSGGAEPGSGSGGEIGAIDAGSGGSVGSGGARAGTGGVMAVSSGGVTPSGTGGAAGSGGMRVATGGVTVAGSGGSVGVASGGASGTGGRPPGSGGTTLPATDAGTDGPPPCTGANHLCGSSCVSNLSVNSCGASCSMCPVPTGGSATCDGTKCGASCNGGKLCNGKCIAASACCGDGDCGAGGKCNTTTNACQAMAPTLYDFNGGISPWTLYMTSPDRLAAQTHVSFDSKNGEGGSGALKVDAPFDAGNQKVELQDTQAMMLNLKGRTIHARVRLGSGLSDDAAHPGAIKLFAKSGANYDYASGVWTNLLGTGWADVTLIADTPDFVQGPFASDQIRQFGFELRVFSDTQRPAAAVVFIDNVGY